MSVAPASAVVLLGNTQVFSAQVANTANTQVTWSVNGTPGGSASEGTISAEGVYTAPADLPASASVEVRATSQPDPTKSASSQVTISSDIVLSVMPRAANVELGAAQVFQASLASSGHPDPTVCWSLAGAACPANCGAIDANGNYTAPQVLPASPGVTISAQSSADPSKQANATATITSNFAVNLSAPSSVAAGSAVSITATLQPVPGSNPSPVLSWTLSGAGCGGAACGTLTVVAIQSGGGTTSATATYTAPNTAPNPNNVTITVTSQADPTRKAQATLTILTGPTGVSLALSPASATRATNHRLTLSVQVSGTSNAAVTWNVNGIPGGNTTFGQICVAGSNPCQVLTSSSAAQVDYIAPGAIPLPNPVTVQAVSQADSTASASAQITLIAHIQVTALPASVLLAPGVVQVFTASVLGTDNQNVVWQIQGAGCGGAASPCGTIDANGFYTAPATAPSPNALQVVAVSAEDTSQTGLANVSISTGANIQKLLPASVYAGNAAGFTLKVEGSGYVPSSPGPGSSLEIAGSLRTTTCSSMTECAAPVQPADVAGAGNLSVQIRNPDGTLSNAVALVVIAPAVVDDVITLSAASPPASGKDIVVVEPTTAGVDLPGNTVDLNVAALGVFSTTNNSCTLAGNPVPLVRPASGTATADLCVFAASGLDASMNYNVSGPGDIAVIAKQPAGLGIIHLTLQIPFSALPGARSLFIQDANLNKTAATGALEVE